MYTYTFDFYAKCEMKSQVWEHIKQFHEFWTFALPGINKCPLICKVLNEWELQTKSYYTASCRNSQAYILNPSFYIKTFCCVANYQIES